MRKIGFPISRSSIQTSQTLLIILKFLIISFVSSSASSLVSGNLVVEKCVRVGWEGVQTGRQRKRWLNAKNQTAQGPPLWTELLESAPSTPAATNYTQATPHKNHLYLSPPDQANISLNTKYQFFIIISLEMNLIP